MKLVCRIDSNGFFIEDVLLKDSAKVPADCVISQPAPGFFWPQYVNGQWVEGGGLYRRETDGSVKPNKRHDPIELEDGSTVKRDSAGKLTQTAKTR